MNDAAIFALFVSHNPMFIMKIKQFLIVSFIITLYSCGGNQEAKTNDNSLSKEVDAYLESYNKTYQQLYAASSEAQWKSNTRIVEGDSTNAKATQLTEEAIAKFTGSVENIEKAKKYLHDELHKIDSGNAEFLTLEEFEIETKKAIS